MICKSCRQEREFLEDGICMICKNIHKGRKETKNIINSTVHLGTTTKSKMGKVKFDNSHLQ